MLSSLKLCYFNNLAIPKYIHFLSNFGLFEQSLGRCLDLAQIALNLTPGLKLFTGYICPYLVQTFHAIGFSAAEPSE